MAAIYVLIFRLGEPDAADLTPAPCTTFTAWDRMSRMTTADRGDKLTADNRGDLFKHPRC